MKRLLTLATLALMVMGIAAPAWAQSLDGGCTVIANSGVDATTVLDATQDDPFDVDPAGTLSWEATSPGPIMNHAWQIWVDVGGFPVPLASGGDPNDDGDQISEGSTDVVPALGRITDQTGIPVDTLRGIYLVGGEISGEGGECSGDAYFRILGGFLDSLLGQIGLGAAIVGLIMFLSAGVAKKS